MKHTVTEPVLRSKKSFWILGENGLNLNQTTEKLKIQFCPGDFLTRRGDQEKTFRIRGFLDNPGELEEILRGNVKTNAPRINSKLLKPLRLNGYPASLYLLRNNNQLWNNLINDEKSFNHHHGKHFVFFKSTKNSLYHIMHLTSLSTSTH